MELEFSACIDMIFSNLPLAKRVAKVAAAGFEAVEFWRWTDKDLGELEEALSRHSVRVAAFCVDPMGRIVDRSTHELFLSGVKESVKTARRLGAKALIVTTGKALEGVPRDEQRAAVIDALKAAAPIAEEAGVTLVLEPLNTSVDHPGYYLVSSAEGFEIVDAVGSPNVKLLFDCYHQQISEGNLTHNLCGNIGKVGHVHVADVPGRHEPGTGEINYANLFQALEGRGYKGFVGLEFRPRAGAELALAQMKRLTAQTPGG